MIKLNLGSGKQKLKGYENIDLMYGTGAYPLQYDLESVDEIRASHILEHFGKHEVQKVLKNWVDKLRPGGVLKIAVPDFDKIAKAYVDQQKMDHSPNDYIMGGQTDENDFHKSMFNETILTKLLESAGLQDIQVWESQIEDCASMPISLNLRGQKPGGVETKIHAVMSAPRLGFTDTFNCGSAAFQHLGILWEIGQGVFWGQVLTRMFEKHEMDGTEYLITVDYDTWFRKEHVIKLLQLMADNPDVDAIVSVQSKREDKVPMFALAPEIGEPGDEVPLQEFEADLVPIINGHFGLTAFRTSFFEGLKKPWFMPHPDPNGSWNEGRIDEDIHFWHNAYDSGKKVCLAPDINLGHLEIMCSFAGKARDGFKPVQYHMGQMNRGEYADYCVPKVELKK
jgi:predicted SAM-dependent methyltransferase